MQKKVIIYTDGACSGNPGPGGWGAILSYNSKNKEISGFASDTTNNRMELTAAIEALKILKEPCIVDLFTDSIYLKDGITKWIINWKKNKWKTSSKKQPKNIDLWQKLDLEVSKHQIKWHWVKAHDGNLGNEKADFLATQAIKNAK